MAFVDCDHSTKSALVESSASVLEKDLSTFLNELFQVLEVFGSMRFCVPPLLSSLPNPTFARNRDFLSGFLRFCSFQGEAVICGSFSGF